MTVIIGEKLEYAEKQPRCPVCEGLETRFFMSIEAKIYWRCDICVATFLDASLLPDDDFERERYSLHENNPGDESYRRFLGRLMNPLLERVTPPAKGLDYGCGPGPVLASMLVEAGFTMERYDPFFFPDESVLAEYYDFVTCTEVAEHFHNPACEFRRLDRMLREGGLLALMTSFQDDDGAFGQWHYRREPTHVVFYREETFFRLAERHGWSCDIPAKDIVFMRKPFQKMRGYTP
ncbi:MAG: class I SAM-dependent methyltransferase [Syntrophales bacterium]|nr:class I SAM-dependent methyltransferase [Syntrophales bacterium]